MSGDADENIPYNTALLGLKMEKQNVSKWIKALLNQPTVKRQTSHAENC